MLNPRPKAAGKGRTRRPETWAKVDPPPPAEHLDAAEECLRVAARHIDRAGELAGTEQADMLACYASNVLQGSLALIRELRRSLREEKGRP